MSGRHAPILAFSRQGRGDLASAPLASASSSTRTPRAKKALGQHFLIDRRVRAKIIDAADLSPSDTVVEIGPGRGFLTKVLAKRAGRVVAVELDEVLVPRLREAFAGCGNVEIVEGDARTVDIDDLTRLATEYKLVANLPYYAATPIVRRFLEASHRPGALVIMVQREVGLQMTARPGKMRLLSVATQVYGRPRIVTSVPPTAFRPSPAVESAVVRIDVHAEPRVAFDSVEGFFNLVKAGFSAPRKQIHNSLEHGLNVSREEVMALLRNAGISPTRRAQTLSIDEWGHLYCQYVSIL